MKIGDAQKSYSHDELSFKELKNKKDVQDAIRYLLFEFQTPPEGYTNFSHFFGRLSRLQANHSGEFAVHIYSDFYHDIDGVDSLNEIEQYQQELTSKGVELYFIDQHYEANRDGIFVLEPQLQNNEYKRYFDIAKLKGDERIPSQVEEEKTVYWFYPHTGKPRLDTRFRLLFPLGVKQIRLIKDIDGFSFIENKNKELLYNKWEYIQGKAINLIYTGKEEHIQSGVDFEIIHDNVHYILPFHFHPQWQGPNDGDLSAIVCVFGFLLGIGIKRINDKLKKQ
jgi:hypothetical protein